MERENFSRPYLVHHHETTKKILTNISCRIFCQTSCLPGEVHPGGPGGRGHPRPLGRALGPRRPHLAPPRLGPVRGAGVVVRIVAVVLVLGRVARVAVAAERVEVVL